MSAPATFRELIDIDELSRLWRVPKATLYNWVNQGRIPYVKLGRCLRFDPAALERFVKDATISTRFSGER